jgi:hypothetical protein
MSLSAADHRRIARELHEIERRLGRVVEQVSLLGIRQLTGTAPEPDEDEEDEEEQEPQPLPPAAEGAR